MEFHYILKINYKIMILLQFQYLFSSTLLYLYEIFCLWDWVACGIKAWFRFVEGVREIIMSGPPYVTFKVFIIITNADTTNIAKTIATYILRSNSFYNAHIFVKLKNTLLGL